jgi:hypothetical protein
MLSQLLQPLFLTLLFKRGLRSRFYVGYLSLSLVKYKQNNLSLLEKQPLFCFLCLFEDYARITLFTSFLLLSRHPPSYYITY